MDDKYHDQIAEIRDVVLSYASMDFSKRAKINGDSDVIDSLSAGVNMLGEELLASSVSLHEKEVLLKEIHHRVKNNLQIISSILNLQAEFSDNPVIKSQFAECQARIKSMALLHEKLYNSEDLKRIELNDYIKAISQNLMDSLASQNIEFEFKCSAVDYYANIDQLLPIGLILSELVSNSLKHAFSGDTDGRIKVELSCSDDKIKIMVADNGVGISDIDLDNMNHTLGLQLVQSLSEQIDGALRFDNSNGTTVSVEFMMGQN